MKKFSIDPANSITSIVQEDYRTADIFLKFGINYCCGGGITLQAACDSMHIDIETVMNELEKAHQKTIVLHSLDFDKWKVDFLIDYIINVHHAYLDNTMSGLLAQVTTFVNNHKKEYPYLQDVLKTFDQLIAHLSMHIRHEEEITFPYMKQIDNAYKRKESYGNLLVRTLRKPLINHEDEHLKLNSLFAKLKELTNNYSSPEKACINHQVIYHKLEEFDDDMTQHKYLEDEVLFPKVMKMEKELLQIQS